MNSKVHVVLKTSKIINFFNMDFCLIPQILKGLAMFSGKILPFVFLFLRSKLFFLSS